MSLHIVVLIIYTALHNFCWLFLIHCSYFHLESGKKGSEEWQMNFEELISEMQ
jgi:hypothetical protein